MFIIIYVFQTHLFVHIIIIVNILKFYFVPFKQRTNF